MKQRYRRMKEYKSWSGFARNQILLQDLNQKLKCDSKNALIEKRTSEL